MSQVPQSDVAAALCADRTRCIVYAVSGLFLALTQLAVLVIVGVHSYTGVTVVLGSGGAVAAVVFTGRVVLLHRRYSRLRATAAGQCT